MAQDASVRSGPSGGGRSNGSARRPARSCSSSSRACRLRLRFQTGLVVCTRTRRSRKASQQSLSFVAVA